MEEKKSAIKHQFDPPNYYWDRISYFLHDGNLWCMVT